MKIKMTGKVLLVCSCLIAALSACKKDSGKGPGLGGTSSQPSSATFTLTGDGHSNEKVTINGLKTLPDNEGTYFISHAFTAVKVADNSAEGTESKNEISVAFDGAKTGSQNFSAAFAKKDGVQQEVNVLLVTTIGGKKYTYSTITEFYSIKPKGTINITKYDAVNGLIEGDFSGTFINVDTGTPVTVTAGHFSAPRHPDNKL